MSAATAPATLLERSIEATPNQQGLSLLHRIMDTSVALELGDPVNDDAITLRQDVAEVLAAESARVIDAARAAARLDPIVYVVQDSAVAIIAQFGDFPIEREVMQKVVNSVHFA